jgi:hypothetical protein
MASQPHDEIALELVESPAYANVTWAPHIVEAANRQRAEVIELSHAAHTAEFDELDDLDWALIEQAAGEIEDAAIALAHEREIDEQVAHLERALELATTTKETTDMAYIPDFGAYAVPSTSDTYEEPLDRAARNRATYGYDPDEFDVPEADGPEVASSADELIERVDWMEQVHKENPLLDLANLKHRLAGESGAAPRKAWLVQGRVNADGVAVHEETGAPVYDRYGQTYSVVDTSAVEERAAQERRRRVDAMKPDAFKDAWRTQFRGAFK